jgi:hypothetical protein
MGKEGYMYSPISTKRQQGLKSSTVTRHAFSSKMILKFLSLLQGLPEN